MKPRKTLSIYVLFVGVMGLSIVGGILAFQIFSASVKYQLTAEQKEIVKPLDGTINETVVKNLQQRRVIPESELISIAILTPTPTAASQSEATPEATQSATISGQLTP